MTAEGARPQAGQGVTHPTSHRSPRDAQNINVCQSHDYGEQGEGVFVVGCGKSMRKYPFSSDLKCSFDRVLYKKISNRNKQVN